MGLPNIDNDLPSAERTLLICPDTTDGLSFADACIEKFSLPPGNVLMVPSLSSGPVAADYASFQAEVEQPVLQHFSREPQPGGQCTCLLLGPGLPGSFMHGGVQHSAVSRLMNLHNPFDGPIANPLYKPTRIERLTPATLGTTRLAARIDAELVDDAVALLDRARAVQDLDTVPADEKICSDDPAWTDSPQRRRLRLAAAGVQPAENDALLYCSQGEAFFGSNRGTRAAAVVDLDASAASMLTDTGPCEAALMAGYASAVGWSDEADDFDAPSFFEMLRIGGTVAEALAVSVSHLDSTAMLVGWPLLSAGLPKASLNFYAGLDSPENVDYAAPIDFARPDESELTIRCALPPGRRVYVGCRRVSELGVEEGNTHVLAAVAVDPQTQTMVVPLPRPTDVTATTASDGSLRVDFSSIRKPGLAQPEQFELLAVTAGGQPDAPPLARVPAQRGRREYHCTIPGHSAPARLGVRARRGDHLGPLSRPVRPVALAASTPPDTL